MSNAVRERGRGWLKNGNPVGDLSRVRQCGANTKREQRPCRAPAMRNGRCRLHGGKSTGPKTGAGLARCRQARLKHGGYSKFLRDERARTRSIFRQVREFLRALR
jgi:hypothetical protein